MAYDFEHMSYKYAKAILSFVFILAVVVTFTRGCINSNIAKEKRTTIPVEVDSEDILENNEQRVPDLEEQESVRENKTSEQKEILQAQERIKKVQKQLAEEDGYSARKKMPAKYIENNESYETIQEEPRARVLDEAPSGIIIEPAD